MTTKTEEIEEREEQRPNDTKMTIEKLGDINKEIEALSEEKMNLVGIEKKLESEIEKETKRREKRRDALKTEVDRLKKNCKELALFVNTFRNEQPPQK